MQLVMTGLACRKSTAILNTIELLNNTNAHDHLDIDTSQGQDAPYVVQNAC